MTTRKNLAVIFVALAFVTVISLGISSVIPIGVSVSADDFISFKGKVKAINVNAKSVVVMDEISGKDIELTIEKEPLLKKFKDGKIDLQEFVRGRYSIRNGKNIADDIRKPGGC